MAPANQRKKSNSCMIMSTVLDGPTQMYAAQITRNHKMIDGAIGTLAGMVDRELRNVYVLVHPTEV